MVAVGSRRARRKARAVSIKNWIPRPALRSLDKDSMCGSRVTMFGPTGVRDSARAGIRSERWSKLM